MVDRVFVSTGLEPVVGLEREMVSMVGLERVFGLELLRTVALKFGLMVELWNSKNISSLSI